MRSDASTLESGRMEGQTIENYRWKHERHRVFPEVFENRQHSEVLDISAGIGLVAKRILGQYKCSLTCNEMDGTCIKELNKLDAKVLSFDIDTGERLPVGDSSYDAIVCLATLEHLINIDSFVKDLHRILRDSGRLYISVPNYASVYWMVPLVRGRTFHDPLDEKSCYEFYAHVRYFTYHSLIKYMGHFGFSVDSVYLPLPEGSTRMQTIRKRSKLLALGIREIFRLLYLLSPRWHQEPVICFQKSPGWQKIRSVIL
jgi:SAM-dependent methyltransferase